MSNELENKVEGLKFIDLIKRKNDFFENPVYSIDSHLIKKYSKLNSRENYQKVCKGDID